MAFKNLEGRNATPSKTGRRQAEDQKGHSLGPENVGNSG